MSDEHTSPIKTPKQLAIVLVLAFLVPIALFLLLSQLVTGVRHDDTGETEAMVLARIKPVGEVTLAGATGARASMNGELHGYSLPPSVVYSTIADRPPASSAAPK